MSDSIPLNAYVIIIGAMKAGTTTLFEMLSQHPSICPSTVKEPAFFVEGQGVKVDRYEDLFTYNPGIHKRCLEASTSYTKSPILGGVPKRMKAYGIDPYFIYSVRDPLERIESDYNYAHFHEKAWAKDELLNHGAICRSMYYMQLRNMMEFYPDKNRYMIVNFDDIITKPVVLARCVFKWIGLQEFEINSPNPQNVTTQPSVIEMRIKKMMSASYRRFIPGAIRSGFKKLLRQKDTISSKKKLTEDQKMKLREQLRPDIEQFGKHFDVDIHKWGF